MSPKWSENINLANPNFVRTFIGVAPRKPHIEVVAVSSIVPGVKINGCSLFNSYIQSFLVIYVNLDKKRPTLAFAA